MRFFLSVSVVMMACALSALRPAVAATGADIAAGIGAHKVTPCGTCHGNHGQGNADAGFPRLAGLNAGYLRQRLQAFASARPQNPVMTPIAKALTPAEIQAVTDYYASLPPPARPSQSGNPLSDRGQAIARRGIWQKAVPGCEQCHGPDGIGVGKAFPPLAGQSAAYIANQLHAWKQGQRPPGRLGLMPAIASKLSDAEIDAVAAYFASLTPATVAQEAAR